MMHKSSDCNKLAYTNKIIKKEANEAEIENLKKYCEQKLLQNYEENEEFSSRKR